MIDENTARYIVRMLRAADSGDWPFPDATDKDEEELARIKERYQEAGRFRAGYETSRAEFIMRVCRDGVPGGNYVYPAATTVENALKYSQLPLIKRPDSER